MEVSLKKTGTEKKLFCNVSNYKVVNGNIIIVQIDNDGCINNFFIDNASSYNIEIKNIKNGGCQQSLKEPINRLD